MTHWMDIGNVKTIRHMEDGDFEVVTDKGKFRVFEEKMGRAITYFCIFGENFENSGINGYVREERAMATIGAAIIKNKWDIPVGFLRVMGKNEIVPYLLKNKVPKYRKDEMSVSGWIDGASGKEIDTPEAFI